MKPSISIKSRQDISAKSTSSSFISSINAHSVSTEMLQQKETTNSLLEIEVPLFEEATQTASRFLGVPICFVGIPSQNTLVLKAAVGLSELGLMNPLARTRRLSLEDSLVKTVLQRRQSLVLPHILENAPYTESSLVRDYGIQSYLGIPLLTSEGTCLGLLAAVNVTPHDFATKAISFMELLARWSVSEYERYRLSDALSSSSEFVTFAGDRSEMSLLDTVRLTLISQLTQEMRNPLTTIIGMSNMLSREVYGSLTPKQREYASIIRNSSQLLLKAANEAIELSALDACMQPLQPVSVDVDMIGQKVRQALLPVIETRAQEVMLTVEPGSRLWTLDRNILHQMLYHLIFSILQLSGEGGTLRVHSSERDNRLNINIRMTHQWLGEGLPSTVVALYQRFSTVQEETHILSLLLSRVTGRTHTSSTGSTDTKDFRQSQEVIKSRETLSLLLSRHLVEHHKGSMELQGSSESGYRFSITLPFLGEATLP